MIEPVTINLRFLSRDLSLPQEQVQAVVRLLDEGFPVPFIARYRKDQTDNLDEDALRLIEEELRSARALCERKQVILKTIDSLGKLTPELDRKIREAKSSKRLEDLYLPFKPKKQTLASQARERGLEPLALEIYEGTLPQDRLDQRASEFINEDKKVLSVADALLGAGHIIAEMFGEKAEVLQCVRDGVHRFGKLTVKKIETEKPAAPVGAKPGTGKKASTKKEDVREAVNNTAPVVTEQSAESVESAEVPASKTEETPLPDAAANEPSEKTSPAEPTETVAPEPMTKTEEPATEETPIEDSSGSGGGDEENVPEQETTEQPTPDLNAEETVAEDAITVQSQSQDTASVEVPTEPKTASTENAEPPSEVREVTEQFQQWKEAREEQGLPVVKSQNTLKKKKKEEIRKKKAEAKVRKQEHFERQFNEYFDYSSGTRNLPPHRILAINRGERVRILKVRIETDEEKILKQAQSVGIPEGHVYADFLTGCLKDALHRLVLPMMERELRNELTESAENQAIRVFGQNLRNLLLQPPLQRRRVLALDPGFRHGCKLVPLDEFGNVLDFETVYLSGGVERREKAAGKIAELIRKYGITVIAIGNGTGCREAEEVISNLIASQFATEDLSYIVVNEAGASVYSVSPIAKEEFPDYDVLLRGAVSIGRRLQDPLNELVKIEPGSLGVGMYQHDIKGKHLKSMLSETVESCVNFVGVDLNTATPAILRYVSGLNQLTARRIYDYRMEHGPFRCREDLKKVPGFGEVTFTHAAGFLKIPGGSNPLDNTWIHPESYLLATQILEKLGFTVDDLRDKTKVADIAKTIREGKIGELASKFASEFQAGLFTVRDILDNLCRPGRDPRESLPPPLFKKGVLHMEDLQVGMELSGTVLNVVDFGAFIDIGLHDSGLVHISQMSDHYIRDAHEKVAVGDVVRVWVVEADPTRKRISLTMLPPGTEKQARPDRRRDGGGDRTHGESAPSEKPRRDDRRDRPKQDGARGRDARGSDRPPRKDGEGRRDDRRHGDRRDQRRDRGPKSYVALPKDKAVKPITEEMKKGKEPLRSFGDLAQLLGRVQVPDPAEEQKRKKEEERRRRAREQSREQAGKPAPPVDEKAKDTTADVPPADGSPAETPPQETPGEPTS